MIYDGFGNEVELVEIKARTLVTVRYLDDQSTEDLDPRTLKANGGQAEIIEATAKTYTSYKQPLIAPAIVDCADCWVKLMSETQARGFEQGARSVHTYLKGFFERDDHEYHRKDRAMTGLEQALANALEFNPTQAKAEDEAA